MDEELVGQFDLIEVTWLDSHTESGWHDITDLRRAALEQNHDALRVTSVGYFLFETPVAIAMAMSLGSNGDVLDCLFIPTASVADARTIRRAQTIRQS